MSGAHHYGKYGNVRVSGRYAKAVRRAPGVPVRAVACLDCGAAIDQPCISANGTAMSSVHVSRRRMATREANRAREEAGTFTANPAAKRGALETDDETVPPCATCGRRIRLAKAGFRVRHTLAGGTVNAAGDVVACIGSHVMVRPPTD